MLGVPRDTEEAPRLQNRSRSFFVSSPLITPCFPIVQKPSKSNTPSVPHPFASYLVRFTGLLALNPPVSLSNKASQVIRHPFRTSVVSHGFTGLLQLDKHHNKMSGGTLFHDCFLTREARRPRKSWPGVVARAWEGMFDCCGGGNRNFVRVGDRVVPRGRRVTESEWESLEARRVVVLVTRVEVSRA